MLVFATSFKVIWKYKKFFFETNSWIVDRLADLAYRNANNNTSIDDLYSQITELRYVTDCLEMERGLYVMKKAPKVKRDKKGKFKKTK
jgi:hypothetical protein